MSAPGPAAADAAAAALRERLRKGGPRFILGITGAPGAGKSTLARRVAESFPPGLAVVVPMDGFHLGNAIINGTPLGDRKGAIDTFDADGYACLLARLRRQHEGIVYAPDFRREIDEPIAASIPVTADVRLIAAGRDRADRTIAWS